MRCILWRANKKGLKMIYSKYIDYAKSTNFQPITESAFNALLKAGFVFTERGLTHKDLIND